METQKDEEIIDSQVSEENTSQIEEPAEVENAHTQAEQELSILKDQLLRAMAETENVRRRAEKQSEESSKFAITNFARDLMSVMDNLYRTTEFLTSTLTELTPELKTIVEGIEMTQKDLMSAFNKNGLKRIQPIRGEKFDYNLHQAVVHVEDNELESGLIVQVTQPGYTLQERLLRPAMVTVSK